MDSTGKYVASAGDRQIRIFHNIAGEFIEIKKMFCFRIELYS